MSQMHRIEAECLTELDAIEAEYRAILQGKQCSPKDMDELVGRVEALGKQIGDAGVNDKELRAHYAAISNVVRSLASSIMY